MRGGEVNRSLGEEVERRSVSEKSELRLRLEVPLSGIKGQETRFLLLPNT